MEPELNVAWISDINVIIALDSLAANPLTLLPGLWRDMLR